MLAGSSFLLFVYPLIINKICINKEILPLSSPKQNIFSRSEATSDYKIIAIFSELLYILKFQFCYNFYEIEMSILEDQDYCISDLLRCKLTYLQQQNSWMKRQYDYLCKLIDTQKKIIHAPQQEHEKLQEQMNNILNQRSQYFTSLKEKPQISTKQIQIQEFVPMIYSFQEKIERLQNQIQKRESHLQSVEVLKNLQNNQEKKSEMKFVNSFQTYSRLLQKIKKEISNLKIKKELLENNLLQISDKNSLESTLITNSQTTNSQSKVTDNKSSLVDSDESSTFQKLMLLIKKKKYQNECLQQKASKMRKGLARKKAINIKLQSQIQNNQWKCFQNIAAPCGYIQGHENPDVSMFGQSFNQNHNASFSFDVSRFIRPKKN